MIPSEYLWNKFLSQGALFNLYKEIFEAEKKAFVVLIIISALIGALALFGAYYQRFLFAQLLDHNFEVSGWVFFAIITTSAILRFFMFNVNHYFILVRAELSEYDRNERQMLSRKRFYQTNFSLA